MDIKLIALDLDRTTLDGSGRLSRGNREALLRAMAAGVHVCIASGRAFDALPRDVAALPGLEYAVTGNGAAVYRVPGRELLCRHVMTPASVDAVVDSTADRDVAWEVFIEGHSFADAAYVADPTRFGVPAAGIPYIQSTRAPVVDMRSFIAAHRTELDSFDVVVAEPDLRWALAEKIRAVTDEVFITSSAPQLLELSHRDAGKGSGVRFLADYLGIAPGQVAAFGDAENDRDMLDFAGVGIAVENAAENLKAAADYVTLRHDEDGVAWALEHILGII